MLASPRETDRLRRWDFWVWPLLILVLTRLPDLFADFHDWDEAAMMAQAWAMSRGHVLYRDIWQIHPFFNFAVFYPFFKALPAFVAPHAIKVLNLLAAWAMAGLAGRIVLRWTDDAPSALGASVALAWLLSREWALSSFGE